MRPWSLPLVLALALPTTGCCSLARLFCGPDRSPWVSVDYATPEAAVRTLLEALRRDDPEIVYRSMSHDCRNRLGLDQGALVVVWPKVREENPGLHVAGYADVPPAIPIDPDHARLELTIEGRRLDVDVVRQRKWEVRYRRDNGTLADPGANLPSFAHHAELTTSEEGDNGMQAMLRIQPLQFGIGFHPLALDRIEFAGIHSEWKVDRLTAHPDS